jgi:type IV secretory pathway VirD2 relaxase
MSKDESDDFKPQLGKPRGRPNKSARTTSALILRSIAEHGGDLRRLWKPPRQRKPSGRFIARGRGRRAAAALEGHGGWEVDPGTLPGAGMRYRARRVVVKARVVKLKGVESQAVASHLRYLQRDGQRRNAYSALEDQVDTKDFAERAREDRHQFRFIVGAEDGVALGDLKRFTRRLMRQVEQDLDTTLDWIAVDHYNTAHPHTHLVVRGITDEGKILYIAGDYIAHGVRARASNLITRELGRQSELEVQEKLASEIDHDRFTRLDCTLLKEARDGQVDLRISPHQSYLVRVNRHLLLARLQKLERMLLAKPTGSGVWELSSKLEPTLRQLGDRIDTLNIIRDALGERAAERSVANFLIHRAVPPAPVTGHLVGKGLAGDGLDDKTFLVIDGVDARVHYLELDAALLPDEARIGAILTLGRRPQARAVDKTIAALAARSDGFYDPRQHFEIASRAACIPDGDFEGHVEAHVRRLEALRRAGIVGRLDAEHWDIPRDFLDRAAAYDQRDHPKVVIEVHSAVALDRQITADAVTWLDRQLVGRHRVETARMGFGHQVEQALEHRKQQLIARGLAHGRADGAIQYHPDLLATLQRRELARVGQQLAEKRGDAMTYAQPRDGAVVRGTYRRAITLTSGKFAIIDDERQFTLVPWRPILERHRGREFVGIVRGMGVSWQFGMQRDRGISR